VASTLAVPIAVAASRGLGRWLASQLTDCHVNDAWPPPDKALVDRTITILRAGEATYSFSEPMVTGSRDVHDAVTPTITEAVATDRASAITRLNAARASYEAHRISVATSTPLEGAHAAADTTNALTFPAAVDIDSALDLANEMRTVVPAHFLAAAHTALDRAQRITAPAATDDDSLVLLTNQLTQQLLQHYVTRVYIWSTADVEQPVQLDVWCAFEVTRDDVIARLEPLLRSADPLGLGVDQDPVQNGVPVPLLDDDGGWAGTDVYFTFLALSIPQDEDRQQRSEFRATYRGTLEFPNLVLHQAPRMTHIEAQVRLSPTFPTPTGTPVATSISTPTEDTFSQG